jgi:hypothetical protein
MLMAGETIYFSSPTIIGPADATTRRQLLGSAAAEALYEP